MLLFLVLTAVTFSLFGFIIGIWADGFEKLQVVPLLVITPLTFLGGSFYSINMLPPLWQKVTLFNPVVYLISGFRWSFYGIADVNVGVSLGMTLVFLLRLPRDRLVDLQDRLSAEEVDFRGKDLGLRDSLITSALLGAAAAATMTTVAAQEAALTYTDAQAARGKTTYDQLCFTCHGPNLDDVVLGPPLKGPAFIQKYGGKTADLCGSSRARRCRRARQARSTDKRTRTCSRTCSGRRTTSSRATSSCRPIRRSSARC